MFNKKKGGWKLLQPREGTFVHCVSPTALCLETRVVFDSAWAFALRAVRAERGSRAEWELDREKEGGLFSLSLREGRRVFAVGISFVPRFSLSKSSAPQEARGRLVLG